MKSILAQDIDDLNDELKRNYQRNEKLINLDNVPEKYIDDGWILNEAALVAAIEYKYPDAEVTYLKNFNEKSLQNTSGSARIN